jgi:hypothetical protein
VTSAPKTNRAVVGGDVALVALVVTVMWIVSAVSMWVYTSGDRAPEDFTLAIPDGTAAAIARGENPLEIPSTWRFKSGDVLTLQNDDGVGHWLGAYYVPSHETATHVLRPSVSGVFACSLHPAGEIVVDVGLRGFDWRMTLIPTLLVGPILGLAAVWIRRTLRVMEV